MKLCCFCCKEIAKSQRIKEVEIRVVLCGRLEYEMLALLAGGLVNIS